jgi:ketosteroid isomerase-like protein
VNRDAEVVLDVFRAIEERDQERLLALHHEEVELYWPDALPYGGTMRGLETLQHRLETEPEKTWLGSWDPVQPSDEERRMDPRVVGSDDGEVVVFYRQRAVSPDGERLDEPVVGIYQVRDGKFARAQMFHYDTAKIVDFLERAHKASAKEAA